MNQAVKTAKPKGLKPSQALIRVKSMLPMVYDMDADNSPYICDNIDALALSGKITTKTAVKIKDHIRELLNGGFSLNTWLINGGYVTREQLCEDRLTTGGMMLQYTRQNWLNDMVFYFKSKGM